MSEQPQRVKRRRRVLPKRESGWFSRIVVLPGGMKVRRGTLVYCFCGLACFTAFVLGVIFLLYSAEERSRLRQATVETPVPAVPPPEPFGPDSRDRLARVLDKHAGATGLKEVHSLIFSGTYTGDGGSFESDLILRRPDQIRHVVKQEGFQTVRVFDGSEVDMGVFDFEWRRFAFPEEAVWLNAFSLIAEGSVGLLAWSHLDRVEGFQVHARGSGMVGETECMQLTSVSPAGAKMDHLVDPVTGKEMARRVIFREGQDESARVIEVEATDFRTIRGMVLPMGYDLRIDGEVVAEVRFDAVRENAGVLPSIFKLD